MSDEAPKEDITDTDRLHWVMNNFSVDLMNQFVRHVLTVGGIGDLSDIRTFLDPHIRRSRDKKGMNGDSTRAHPMVVFGELQRFLSGRLREKFKAPLPLNDREKLFAVDVVIKEVNSSQSLMMDVKWDFQDAGRWNSDWVRVTTEDPKKVPFLATILDEAYEVYGLKTTASLSWRWTTESISASVSPTLGKTVDVRHAKKVFEFFIPRRRDFDFQYNRARASVVDQVSDWCLHENPVSRITPQDWIKAFHNLDDIPTEELSVILSAKFGFVIRMTDIAWHRKVREAYVDANLRHWAKVKGTPAYYTAVIFEDGDHDYAQLISKRLAAEDKRRLRAPEIAEKDLNWFILQE